MHSFKFKNLSSADIYISWSFGNALYITNVFSFPIEEYFIDTLESILKLFQVMLYFTFLKSFT